MKIKVDDYYCDRSYFTVMQPEIFNALEKAFKAGDEYVDVDKELFEEMIEKYKHKTQTR